MIIRAEVYRIVVSSALVGALVALTGEFAAAADTSGNQIIPAVKVGLSLDLGDVDSGGPGQEIEISRPGMKGPNCPVYCASAKTQCLIGYQKNQRMPSYNPGCRNMYMTCVAKCSP